MARIPMMLTYEQYTCDEPLVGLQARAYYALDEAFGKPCLFYRADAVLYLQAKIGCTRLQAHNAYSALLDKGLVQVANVDNERVYNPFRINTHEITCECAACAKELTC